MPFEYSKEGTKNTANSTKKSIDLVRLARQEADTKRRKEMLDALPSLHQVYLQDSHHVNTLDKGDTDQILEPDSTEDQLISGSFDSIRRLNPTLAAALQAQWEAKKARSHDPSSDSNPQETEQDLKLKDSDISEKTVIGIATLGKNKPNQDAFFIDKTHKTFAVFDGVGGRPFGDIASKTARDFIQSKLEEFPDDDTITAKKVMKKILRDAHTVIDEEKLDGMSTTASVVKILKDRTVVIGNAGDSRVYLLRKGSQSLEHLTIDNASASTFRSNTSYLERQLDIQKQIANLDTFEGDLPPEIRTFINLGNLVSNALGGEPPRGEEPNPAIYTYQLQPGDRLALTTDGIHDNLTDKQIADCMLKNTSNDQKAADAMVEAATQVINQFDREKRKTHRSKPDDRTAVVVEIE